jgi:hypothetical protein
MTIFSAATIRQLPRPLVFVFSLLLAGLPASASNQQAWEPIAPADLAATECKAYPGSSAEVLLDRQTLNTSASENQVAYIYRQMKVYSPKGAVEAGLLKMVYPPNIQIADLAARLTKPNGTVTEFSRKDTTAEIALKVGATKMKSVTLIIPDLGAGDVVDLGWSATLLGHAATAPRWWYIQGPLPVRHFLFSVKESIDDCLLQGFNLPVPLVKASDPKKPQIELYDVPPFFAEPHMPPLRDASAWCMLLNTPVYLRYRSEEGIGQKLSKYREDNFRSLIKPNAEIKAKAAELVKGAASDGEKLQRLYDFCQQQIGNLSYFDSADMQKTRKKQEDAVEEQTAAQTYAKKSGEGNQINDLFASLAKAAGFEVRLVMSASRDATLRVQHSTGWAFMSDLLVAVRVQEAWRFYSPGDYFVPAGMIPSENEGATSLLCDPKKMLYETNPRSSAEQTLVKRKGRFTLDAEGNLEGEIEISLGGHTGIKQKKESLGEMKESIDTAYRSDISRRLPSAEVGELQWENLTGTTLPVLVRYHLKVPAYADLAGTKIIMPLNVFEHGAPAVFASESRKYSIYFDYAWTEQDDIEITLPDGFTLDLCSAPEDVGDTKKILGANYRIRYAAEERKIIYGRTFALGGNGTTACKAVSYPALKGLFDEIQHADEHTLVLQPVAAAAGP